MHGEGARRGRVSSTILRSRRQASVPPSNPGRLVSIIKADESHLDAAWSIVRRCRDALRECGVPQWDDVYPTRETVAGDIVRGGLYVLIDSAECVATVAVDTEADALYATVPWRFGEPALIVHRLCVDPGVQGRGVGGLLMDVVEADAARDGYASIRLDAYTGNPNSLAFYRRRGYREAGQVMFPRRSLPFACLELAVGATTLRPATP